MRRRCHRKPKCPGCGKKSNLEIRVLVDCPITDFRNGMPVYDVADGSEQEVTIHDEEIWCQSCEQWFSLAAFIEANRSKT